jgi:hypothetical protein
MARIAPSASKRAARSRGLPPACRWTYGPKCAGKQSMCTCRQRAKSRRIESLTGHSAGRGSQALWGGGACDSSGPAFMRSATFSSRLLHHPCKDSCRRIGNHPQTRPSVRYTPPRALESSIRAGREPWFLLGIFGCRRIRLWHTRMSVPSIPPCPPSLYSPFGVSLLNPRKSRVLDTPRQNLRRSQKVLNIQRFQRSSDQPGADAQPARAVRASTR